MKEWFCEEVEKTNLEKALNFIARRGFEIFSITLLESFGPHGPKHYHIIAFKQRRKRS